MEKKFMKVVTFSYDDGVETDRRLIEIFNKYGMKCSFNLNSGLFGVHEPWDYKGFAAARPAVFDPSIYEGHEICLHGSKHLWPTRISDEELVREFRDDKEKLEQTFGQKIVGGAYAFGDYNDHVEEYLKSLGIEFCRSTKITEDFTPSEDMLAYKATCHHNNEHMYELIDRFLSIKDPETPQIFYIWGHSYEFGGYDNWDHIEKVCQLLSGQDDVLYGTNTEVFRYFGLID